MKLVKIFTLLIAINMTGCYTVIFSPDMEYPTINNYQDDSYYYPGGEGPIVIIDYYYLPWWVGYEIPVITNRTNDLHDLRTNIGGRNPVQDIPFPILVPTRSGDDNNGSGNSGSTQTNTKKETRNDDNRNETRTKNDDSNKKNPIRSNDGSRSNDNKRKR